MPMSDDALIRLANLKALGYSSTELVQLIGNSYQYWRDLMAGKKSFGEKAARNIEEKLHLPRGCLDLAEGCGSRKDEADDGGATKIGGASVQKDKSREIANVIPAALGGIRIPVINYVQAGMWSGVIDGAQHSDADDWLTTDQQLSRSAFALEIKGESMLPEFKPGDRVIIDPDVAPFPGDFVVAKNGEEEATFKKYRPRGADATGETIFELVPLNDDFASMRSDLVPIRIVGTMVEHRKYRRAR